MDIVDFPHDSLNFEAQKNLSKVVPAWRIPGSALGTLLGQNDDTTQIRHSKNLRVESIHYTIACYMV